jgi:hypothetical protein
LGLVEVVLPWKKMEKSTINKWIVPLNQLVYKWIVPLKQEIVYHQIIKNSTGNTLIDPLNKYI